MSRVSRPPCAPPAPHGMAFPPPRVLRGGRGLLLVFVLALSACATIQPGQDPLVVRVERVLKVAPTIYDQTMSFAQRNASTMSPGALKLVNEIRVTFPPLYRSVDAALQVYKANGTGDVMGQIVALERLITQMATLVSALGGPDLLPQEAK